jgi:hypothetical protein
MKRSLICLATLVLSLIGSVYADYSVNDKGIWPNTWPKELEPLRKQAHTLVGPMVETSNYVIPFTKREEFEAAWPFILKVKSPGAPLILRRPSASDFFKVLPAGVLIHSPPAGSGQAIDPKLPLTTANFRQHLVSTTYIDLVVDGDIVDLNRIPLPANTLIIDERFTEQQKK